ncbi:hypothetical protein CAPTEDRAFT_194968 [Capitella teleta]|uniref:Endonuclease/exonuclease/phosphatase domain-containing protein n=1 Tax=Capitella teleta TaxID=283909 RepID=R7VG58_CAPTE|nr:hypothetical protein CAPTEDRAFT_194968 [Capitella teleta]|eukprot:ELU17828.1 hypothetical protein CAPTEDRAFT_194968 [Capitella teleta]
MPLRPPLGRLLLERLAWLLRLPTPRPLHFMLPTPRPLPTLRPQLRPQPTPRMLVKTPIRKKAINDSEHWGGFLNSYRLERQIEDVRVFGKSGMDETLLLMGRPHGRCALVVRKSIKCVVEPIESPCKRLYFCIVRLPQQLEFILHNVYMPTDTQCHLVNLDDFCDVLSQIELIGTMHANLYTILGGDFKTDLTRLNFLHIPTLTSFCVENFSLCANMACPSADYSFSNAVNRSLIDHSCVSSEIADQVIEYRCIHRGDNLSDHEAVVLTLQLDGSLEKNDFSEPRNRSSMSWSKASENDLASRVLSLLLAGIQLPEDPLRCTTLCNNNNHCYLIETYSVSISNVCIAAAEICIPKTKQRRRVAGWFEHVQELKASSIMWHRIWEECGRPVDGVVEETAKHAKRVYKRMVKWVLSHQNELSNVRMAEAMTRGSGRDFWCEVQKKTRSSKTPPNVVDGVEGDDIEELFRDKFDQLYNCLSYEVDEMNELKFSVLDQINNVCQNMETALAIIQ